MKEELFKLLGNKTTPLFSSLAYPMTEERITIGGNLSPDDGEKAVYLVERQPNTSGAISTSD